LSDFGQQLNEADNDSLVDEERAILNSLRTDFAAYGDIVKQQVNSRGQAPADGLIEKSMALAKSMSGHCKRLVELNESQLNDSANWSSRLSSVVGTVRMGVLIAGPMLGLMCGFWVARGLHQSISRISITLGDATGSLEQEVGRVNVFTPGDLPALQQQVQLVATRIRMVADQLQKARRQAMRSERLAAAGELAAGVAHELRNPLTSVKLLVQTTALHYPERALTQQQLRIIEEEIARMENTIQGLLDFARPPQMNRVFHDIRDTVRRAVNLVEGHAVQHKVGIAERFPKTPVIVDADPEQLHQVLVNLLLNGIESMPKGGVLEVAIDASDGTCRLSVTDSGVGIPPAIMERIFEPFVTDKERGTGLGLAVSRRIIQEHGGRITAANRDERGAVFCVELPLAEKNEPVADESASA
jgi:signal transduction histidine kinase